MPNYIPKMIRTYHRTRDNVCFSVDLTRPDKFHTAKDWAGKGFTYIDEPNVPLNNLQIVSRVLRRDNIVYYVRTESGNVFNLSGDYVYQALMSAQGVGGGLLGGCSWIWAVYGSQYRLILVGSEEYNELVHQDGSYYRDISQSKVAIKDLVPGAQYLKSTREGVLQYTFVGFVSHVGHPLKQQLWFPGELEEAISKLTHTHLAEYFEHRSGYYNGGITQLILTKNFKPNTLVSLPDNYDMEKL